MCIFVVKKYLGTTKLDIEASSVYMMEKEDKGNGMAPIEAEVASTNTSSPDSVAANKILPVKTARRKPTAKAAAAADDAAALAREKLIKKAIGGEGSKLSSREKKAPNRDLPKNPVSKKAAALDSMSAETRKKIADLEKKERSVLSSQIKVDADLKQVQKKVVNVKWPVKDELVLEHLRLAQDQEKKRGSKKLTVEELQAGLPSPQIPVLLINQGLACDAISCWDFMTVFGGEMELNNMPLDHFTELLQFTGRDSPALVEVFTAPLRVVLADEALANRLSISIPLETNFARKETAIEKVLDARGGTSMDVAQDSTDSPRKKHSKVLSEIAKVRDNFRALRKLQSRMNLLPRELTADLLNVPLEWQEVLACVFMYLPPVARLLRLNAELLEALVEYEAQTPVELKQEDSMDSVGMDIDCDGGIAPDSMETDGDGQEHVHQSKQKKRVNAGGNGDLEEDDEQDPDGVNLDNILKMTGDVQAALSMCKDSVQALNSGELYASSCEVKVFILKALFESCCDTSFFRDLLAANHNSIQEKRKEMKEAIAKENAKKRQGTKEVIAMATALCREENKVKAEAAAAKKAAADARKEAAAAKKTEKDAAEAAKKAGGDGLTNPSSQRDQKVAAPAASSTSGTSSSGGAKKGSKGKKGDSARDPLDPAPTQLNNKIAELLLLRENGVDEVRPDPPVEELSDSEDEIEMPKEGGDSKGLKRRKKSRSRQEEREREERKKERRAQLESIEIANENLEDALEKDTQKDLKRAIRDGADLANLKWYDKSTKKTCCTPLMQKAFKALKKLSDTALQIKQDMEMEEVLEEYVVRTEPLGYDRYFNEYYCFKGDRHRLYVRIRSEVPVASLIATTATNSRRSSNGGGNFPNIVLDLMGQNSDRWTEPAQAALTRLYDVRPLKVSNPERATWGIYGGAREIFELMEALDERGVREKSLKYALKGKYGEFGSHDVDSEPTVYQYDHKWVGRRVRRVHKERHLKPSVGIIDGWLPEDEAEGDPALWHCKYKDGDEEELDLKEMTRFLIDTDEDNTYFIPPFAKAGEGVRGLNKSASSVSITSSHSLKDGEEVATAKDGSAAAGDTLASLPAPGVKGGKKGGKKDIGQGVARYSKPVDVQLYMQRYTVQDSQDDTEDEDPAAASSGDGPGRSLSGRAIKAVKSFGNEEEEDEKRRARESAMLKAQLAAKFRDEEPEVCSAYSNAERGYRHKPAQRDNIGLPALQRRLKSSLSQVCTALKAAGLQNSLARDVKGALASSIDCAKTSADLSSVVLELEAFIHQIQESNEEVDLDDQNIAREKQQLHLARLKRHDWWLDPKDSPFIGKTVRRFFSRTGGSNGVVIAAFSKCARPNNRLGMVDPDEEKKERKDKKGRIKAPPVELADDEPDETAVYMIEHEDGEMEKVDEQTLLTAMEDWEVYVGCGENMERFFGYFDDQDINESNAETYKDELNSQKYDMLWPVKHRIIASTEGRKRGQVNERRKKKASTGGKSGGRSRARDDDSTESEDEDEPEVEATKTIWHTAGVRGRWQEGARSATTVAGVALALSTLMAASGAYGVISEQGDDY